MVTGPQDVRILIVDDSPAIVQSLSQILTLEGYQVESCGDGENAWARLTAAAERRQSMPDLVLLDLNMPRADGLEVLHRMRADERFALLPVIILTVESDPETRLQALQEGANDYLPKPIQAVELLARVNSLVALKLAERRQQQRMEGLIEAGRVLFSTQNLDRVLRRAMEIAMEGLEAEGASVWLCRSRNRLQCRAVCGDAADRLVGTWLEPGQGIAGWTLEHRQSLVVTDAQADPRFHGGVDRHVGFETRDLISVPLVVQESSVGVLQAVNKEKGTFTHADLAWLEVLAPLAAAAIANAQILQTLRQRTGELEASNQELDAFAHTVAHDLKSPLAQLVGYAEALRAYRERLSEQEMDTYLATLARGGRKMSRIVDELLLLAGVRTMEVELQTLDMATIVEEAMQRLSSLIEQHQAEVVLPESWPAASGYAPWVEEVWVNYISNAIKYGGRPPCVALGAEVLKDGSVRFHVRDNGPGMAPEAQIRLFTPFTRLDQVHAEGHGLGLSIVRRIVEKLGGTVGVQSQVGKGSVFTFTLPPARAESIPALPTR